MLTEKTVNLIKRAVKAGNTAPTIAQLKTLATAIGDAESYKALNTATIHDIIDIKKKCALFGKDKPDKVSDGKGNLFGLEGKDTTIASEKQDKIFDPKPVEKPDTEMKNIAERKKVEEFHPDTSDRKVEHKTVSEPLKEKPQFPEVLNRGEKQQKEIAKETAASVLNKTARLVDYSDNDEIELWIANDEGLYNWALSEGLTADEVGDSSSEKFIKFIDDNRREIVDAINNQLHPKKGNKTKETISSKKRAWTEDESDVTPIAKQVMDINADIWEKNGWEDGSMVKMDVLKEALKDIAPQVTQADLDVLEDYNNHSAYQAITELNPKARTSSKVASPQFPTHLEDSLLDGFSIQELIDTVIHNEPTRDPQAVQRVFKEMLDFSVQNANETLNSELQMILSEISDYEKRGSKTAAENPFEKKPEKGEKVEKSEDKPKEDKPEPSEKKEPKEKEPKEPKEPSKEKKEPEKEPDLKDIMDLLLKLTKVVEMLAKQDKPEKPVSKPTPEVHVDKAPVEKLPVEKPVAKPMPEIHKDKAEPLPVINPKEPIKKLIQSLQKVLADFAQGDIVELADTGAQVTVDSMGKGPDGKTVLVGKDSSGNVISIPEGTQVKQNTEVKPII